MHPKNSGFRARCHSWTLLQAFKWYILQNDVSISKVYEHITKTNWDSWEKPELIKNKTLPIYSTKSINADYVIFENVC